MAYSSDIMSSLQQRDIQRDTQLSGWKSPYQNQKSFQVRPQWSSEGTWRRHISGNASQHWHKKDITSSQLIMRKSSSINSLPSLAPSESEKSTIKPRSTSLETLPSASADVNPMSQVEVKPDWKEAMAVAIRESQTKTVNVPDWVIQAVMK